MGIVACCCMCIVPKSTDDRIIAEPEGQIFSCGMANQYDENVYKKHEKYGYITHDRKLWSPTFAFEIKEGQAMFMPPGMIHVTKNTGKGCAGSVTYQFPVPSPAIYWRTFLPRVTRTGDLANCQANISILAGAGKAPSVHQEVAEAWQEARFRFVRLDTDRSGLVSLDELSKAVEEGGSGYRFQHFTSTELLAEDIMMYHDLDEDNVITLEEFQRNYAAWSVNQYQVNTEKPVFWEGAGGDRDDGGDDGDDADL